MTGLSEYRSKSAALLRIVTCAVIVLALLACDNGQPGTLTDNGEVMLTLRISLPTATDGSTATRAITSNEENAIDIAQLKVLVFKANSSTETFSYEAPQIQLQDEGNIVILFNGFQKKTQKTPNSEIEKAIKIKEAYYADKQSSTSRL